MDLSKLLIPTSLQTTVLLIDRNVLQYDTFVDNVNTSTYPLVYSDDSNIFNFITSNFKVITRIGVVCYGGSHLNLFLRNNILFLINLINKYQVKNIDYLGCDTLNYSEWTDYYNTIKSETGIIVGASNDKTGNIKHGGNWLMESTNEDIEVIYFTSGIENYAGLLDNPTVISGNDTFTDIKRELLFDKDGNVFFIASIDEDQQIYGIYKI